jgi:hypothetical protein
VRNVVFFILSCCCAFILPYLPINTNSGEPNPSFPGWPSTIDTHDFQPIALSKTEAKFALSFPGRIAKFSNGQQTIQVRWITKPTRKLHPASDCFKGIGYRVRPLSLLVDKSGAIWSRIQCVKGSSRLVVRERIFDNHGQAWTDVSSWYWNAVCGRSNGPWWSVTIVEGHVPGQSLINVRRGSLDKIDSRRYL